MTQLIELLKKLRLKEQGEGPRNESQPTFVSGLQNSSGINNTASTSNVPRNILAFRTITTLLAQLPRSTPIEAVDNLETRIMDSNARQQVKVSDAFAHLAVGEHDVTALTTNYGFPNDTKLRVVACTNNPLIGENLPIRTQPARVMAQVWHLMLTWNVLRDEEESSSKDPHPTIVSPSKPDDLGERNTFAYMVGLELHCECSVITLLQCTLTY